MKPGTRLVAALLMVVVCSGVRAQDLIVYCAGAVKPALSALLPAWTAQGGRGVAVTYAPAGELLGKLAAGGSADIVILPAEALATLEKQGATIAATRRDLGAVGIGIAVKAGARLPDVATEAGLQRALLDAGSVTFMDPARGTSGRYFDEVVLPRLGIRATFSAIMPPSPRRWPAARSRSRSSR